MAYNATYDEADIAESVINVIVKVLIVFGTFVTLGVVVMMYTFVRKKLR